MEWFLWLMIGIVIGVTVTTLIILTITSQKKAGDY